MFNPNAKIPLFGDTAKVHAGANQCTGANTRGPTTLPGVLDHRDFVRVKTDLGWCSVCDEGRAVYRSGDGRERSDRPEHEKPGGFRGCYGRLVREWNEKRGLGR